jgi:NADPH2:quinone reductase
MKVIKVEQAGGPENLVLVDAPKPRPGPGQILVELQAIGVNFADILCRRASHPGMPAPPLVPGCEGSGLVEALGEGTTRFRVGDRVALYSPPGGTYARWVTVRESYALPLSSSMSFEDGAAFIHVFLTAYHALFTLGRAREGEWALVTAAAGGVGTAILQLAGWRGMHLIAGVGSEAKVGYLAGLGVEQVVDYGSTSLADRVLEITGGRGVDLVLESVGGALFHDALRCLAPLGRFILFGMASGRTEAAHPNDLLRTSSTFAALNLSVLFAHAPELVERSWRELLSLYEQGRVRPLVEHRFALEQAAAAHRLMESRASVGKILLFPAEDSSGE